MPKKHKRYRSEREIIALINQCERDSVAALKEAESLEDTAKQYFRMPDMVEDAKFKMSEAVKMRERARRLIDIKSKKLGEKLAEFRTDTMDFLKDPSVQSI